MPDTFEAARGITAVDTKMTGRERVTSAYLVRAAEPALVETGPTTSVDAVRAGLSSLGIGPEDLAHIVVTHIHLDHAGGAGALAPHYPNATVWVHERGARHLVDPAKLVASAARVYGGEDELNALFGPVHPVPAERVRAVDDGDTIELGDRRLDVVYTPGHASHQVALFDSDTGAVFTGDAMGVFLGDVGILRPATPPPEFDLDLAVESVRRIAEREPPLLLFSHFGPAEEVAHLCALGEHRLRKWTEITRAILRDTDDLERVTERLREETSNEFNPRAGDDDAWERYEVLSSIRMNAMGLTRYLQTRDRASA